MRGKKQQSKDAFMPDRRHILLVLENGIAEMLKVRYTGDSSQHAFNHAVAMHQHEGFSGYHDIRCRDKASEFIKYIAVAPSLAAIIWGSDEDIVTGRRRKNPSLGLR